MLCGAHNAVQEHGVHDALPIFFMHPNKSIRVAAVGQPIAESNIYAVVCREIRINSEPKDTCFTDAYYLRRRPHPVLDVTVGKHPDTSRPLGDKRAAVGCKIDRPGDFETSGKDLHVDRRARSRARIVRTETTSKARERDGSYYKQAGKCHSA